MPRTLSNGLVVVFEGIDGIGKSTQIKLAQEALQAEGWEVFTTRNLGGTPIGELLRAAMLQPVPRPPLSDLYISVAIQEALVEVIAKERAEGKIVLMDRSPLSLAAYQIYGSGIEAELGWTYVDRGMQALHPELILVFNGDVQKAVNRARQQSARPDYFEEKPFEYFEKVAKGYDIATKRYNAHPVDAERSIDGIHEEIMALIAVAQASSKA